MPQASRVPAPHGDPLRKVATTRDRSVATTLPLADRDRSWESPNARDKRSHSVTIAVGYSTTAPQALDLITDALAEPSAPRGCQIVFGYGLWKGQVENSFTVSAFTDAKLSAFIFRLLVLFDQECAFVSIDDRGYCCSRFGWKELS